MGDGTTRGWHCQQNCSGHDWSKRWQETMGNPSGNMSAVLANPVTIGVNGVCWIAGYSKGQIRDDLVSAMDLISASGGRLWMYGHREQPIDGGRVLIAIVCDGSPIETGDRSSALKLLPPPGSGGQRITYAEFVATLMNTSWGA